MSNIGKTITDLSPKEQRELLAQLLRRKASKPKYAPLSFAQERMWFFNQLHPESPFYNVFGAARLSGSLDIAVLERSLREIEHRHESLRTTFRMIDGQPMQVIAPIAMLKLPIVHLCGLPEGDREAEVKRLMVEESQRPCDLQWGPLHRFALIVISKAECLLLFTRHHIIFDKWSMGVFLQELKALYEAFSKGKSCSLPELSVQYSDFALWQRQWLQGENLEKLLDYWKQRLAGAPPLLELPTDRPRPKVQSFQGAIQTFILSKTLSEALQNFSRKENVTLFMTLLTAFVTLLHRYSRQEDIVVGTDIANRNHLGTESLIGFFINALVLRIDMGGNPSFRELLMRVREVVLGAYDHQDLPFEKLVEALRPRRNPGYSPLFQVLFVLQNTPHKISLELPDLTITPVEIDNGTAKFDLALFMTESEQGIIGSFNYSTALFNASSIAKIWNSFQALLSAITIKPSTRISSLEMLTSDEKNRQVVQRKQHKASKLKKLMAVQPRAVDFSQEMLIKTDYLHAGETLPLVMMPANDEVDAIACLTSNREFIESKLLHHGAILLRGFGISSSAEFESLAEAVCPRLFGEYGDLPREGVSGKVYGATPYPPEQAILFHNESSHMHCWPQKILFLCLQPAQEGGETPIVDCRKVLRLLDAKLRTKFEQKQLMYVRNYTDGLDVSWQDFFHTTDKAVVEDYCHKASISVEWKPDGGLKTRQIRPAIIHHSQTGDPVFFNQIQLHHAAYLRSEVRESLMSSLGEDNLPRHVYYGDGSPIEDWAIEEILATYQEAKVSFPWRQGDVLMLDNMLTAHGRHPYIGSRKIVVAMGDMIHGVDPDAQSGEKTYAN